MKKIIFIIKSTIKLILIYSFIHAVSNIIFSLYPIETSQEKIIEILTKKYEDNQCMRYMVKDGYLNIYAIKNFNIFEVTRKIKISKNYYSDIEYTCDVEMENKRKFLLELENIKEHTI